MTPNISLLYVTCSTTEQAKSIARHLLEAGLVACANILPQMLSIYRWQGEMREEGEAVLILKTTSPLVSRARDEILSVHPYEVPCVLELPVGDASEGYARWLGAQVEGDRP